MTPHVLTGYGVVSLLGIGRQAFDDALAAPKTLAETQPPPAVTFDSSKYPNAAVSEVVDFDAAKYLGDKGLRVLDRLTKLMVVAARFALQDAGIKRGGEYLASSPERTGVCSSNAYGSLEAITELDRVAQLEDARYINPAKFPNTVSNSASGYVSIWEDARALNVAVSDGNCGGLDAFACAELFLDAQRADVLLVGGAEAMSEALYLAFAKMGMSRGARLAEAAAFTVLESRAHATRRGAKVLADVVGYGTAFTAPPSEGSLAYASEEAVLRALASALEDAKLTPADIDLVVSSHSGLVPYDSKEASALTRTFGTDVAVVAPKQLFGETLGAGGVMGVAAALSWLGGRTPAPLLRGRLPSTLRHVVVTSMGFYGNASALVLRAPRDSAAPSA